tara:strand:- start:35 stop:1171 length:1137 start_codon:yes stop_codon:yes gene_type:complete
MTITRREFIAGVGSITLLASPVFNARAAGLQKRNLVIIMLRGGMDGLTAVPPRDKRLNSARPDILVKKTKKLTSDFDLHPRLETFHELWQAGQAGVVHATNIPYTNRSHFEGQNLMESGGHVPYGESTGWLGRGLEAAELGGLAISLPMPLLLRGNTVQDNFFPTHMALPYRPELITIAGSYPQGSEVSKAMEKVIARPKSMMRKSGSNDAADLADTAAIELARADGPRVAVFDLDGFDTHAAQGGDDGEHGERLSDYDEIIKRLREGLGDAFDNTLILTLTEFGRKLDQNGGYGTEHGYGTAVMMAGGLVRKRIYADWPGLKTKELFDGQDLNATIDARAVYCSAMVACFDVDFGYMRKHAFWDEPLPDLTDVLFKV